MAFRRKGLIQGKELPILSPMKQGEIFRWYTGQPLNITAVFEEAGRWSDCALYTNLQDPQWANLPLPRQNEKTFSHSIVPSGPGLYYAKLFCSEDGGETWYEAAGPHYSFFVDPPTAADLRLYTMIPTVSGTINDWKQLADHVADIGFNAIHLLPITTMGSSESPYSVADPFSIDPSFSDPVDSRPIIEQFASFRDHVAGLKLHLSFDLVLNHTAFDGVLASEHPDWLEQDPAEQDGLKRAGTWHKQDWIRWEDLVLINHYHPEEKIREKIWNYLLEYALLWANYAAQTEGLVRFDNLHASKGDFILWLSKELKKAYPHLLFLGEYFADTETTSRQTPKWQINLLTANAWERSFVPQLRDYITYIHRDAAGLRFLLSLSSHDTEAPAAMYGTAESTLPRHFVAACMGTGQSGMVQGVEDGIPSKIDFIGRKGRYENPTPRRFSQQIRDINNLAARFTELRTRGNITFVDDRHESIIGVVRTDGSGSRRFLLLANLDIHNRQTWVFRPELFPDSPVMLKLNNIVSNKRLSLDSGGTILLEPCGYSAYFIED